MGFRIDDGEVSSKHLKLGSTRPLRMVVLVIAFLTLSFVQTEHANAHVNSSVNGCTLSPDGIFHNDCDLHDTCYDAKSTPNTEAGRLRCDDGFLAGMRETCTIHYGRNSSRCQKVAKGYYLAVRQFGKPFFQNPNKN
jgi:Prokaryotic phospholipase A2